jgi:hypothetical protein
MEIFTLRHATSMWYGGNTSRSQEDGSRQTGADVPPLWTTPRLLGKTGYSQPSAPSQVVRPGTDPLSTIGVPVVNRGRGMGRSPSVTRLVRQFRQHLRPPRPCA